MLDKARKMNDFDLGWVVAFLEGEGSFHSNNLHARGRVLGHALIRASQKDLEPLERLQRVVGSGKIYTYKNRQQSAWVLTGVPARELMTQLRPHMSARRQSQIDFTLANSTTVAMGSPERSEQCRIAGKTRTRKANLNG